LFSLPKSIFAKTIFITLLVLITFLLFRPIERLSLFFLKFEDPVILEYENYFYRDLNNNIKIEINSPFKEIYFINEDGIEIHDLEFNQKRFIKNQDIPNNILKFIKNGFRNESLDFEQIDDSKFKITESEKNYYFEFISNNTLQIKYKDNMNLDNLINFSKQSDK